MPAASTRSKGRHAVFGYPKELRKNMLPTSEDIFKAYCFYQGQTNYDTANEIAKSIASEVIEIYKTASIPTIEFESIVKKIIRLIEKGKNLRKYPELKRTSITYRERLSAFNNLFDICSCKCVDVGIVNRKHCICPVDCKIPALEWNFWVDQKSTRKMVIGKIDLLVTGNLVALADKKSKSKHFEVEMRREMSKQASASKQLQFVSSSEDEDKASSSSEDTKKENYDNESYSNSGPQNRQQYPELSKTLDRANVSNRDACLIANALLKDLGLLSHENALDPSKLRRQRSAWRLTSVAAHKECNQGIVCLGFDGKIDATLSQCPGAAGRKRFCRKVKEEHYVLVTFPSGKYLDHVVPSSGKSADVSQEILLALKDYKSEETLRAVVCDGTVVNTGKNNGIIRNIENHIQRPVQWLICLLHCNELTLRKLIEVVEGRTTGPKTSEGKISDMLEFEPQQKPIIDFTPVPGVLLKLADNVMNDLSTDQMYLLKICLLIQRGYKSNGNYISYLQFAQPGSISHARWLTKANRVLRLYVSQKRPSKNLKRIVKFIVNFYAPSWFHIKSHPSCQDGSKNFFFMLSLFRNLDINDQTIIAPVLQNNNYFCHPENILLAAISDDNEDIRKFASEKILLARHEKSSDGIRCFDKHTIMVNFKAKSYINMVDWDRCDFYEPPLLQEISSEAIGKSQQVILPHYPCHSQNVERNIKDVSTVSRKVYGHESRHGVIVQMKKSRLDLPTIETKSDFLK